MASTYFKLDNRSPKTALISETPRYSSLLIAHDNRDPFLNYRELPLTHPSKALGITPKGIAITTVWRRKSFPLWRIEIRPFR